jgi:hypothetical protein
MNPYGNTDSFSLAINIETFILKNGGVLDLPIEGTSVDMKIDLYATGKLETWKGRVVESDIRNTAVYVLQPANGPGFVIQESCGAKSSLDISEVH